MRYEVKQTVGYLPRLPDGSRPLWDPGPFSDTVVVPCRKALTIPIRSCLQIILLVVQVQSSKVSLEAQKNYDDSNSLVQQKKLLNTWGGKSAEKWHDKLNFSYIMIDGRMNPEFPTQHILPLLKRTSGVTFWGKAHPNWTITFVLDC